MKDSNIDRGLLLEVLEKWEAGVLGESEIQEWAETFTDGNDYPDIPHDDDRSITYEVLLLFDGLPLMDLRSSDIPAIRRFLSTPPGEAAQGWREWEAYQESQD